MVVVVILQLYPGPFSSHDDWPENTLQACFCGRIIWSITAYVFQTHKCLMIRKQSDWSDQEFVALTNYELVGRPLYGKAYGTYPWK